MGGLVIRSKIKKVSVLLNRELVFLLASISDETSVIGKMDR